MSDRPKMTEAEAAEVMERVPDGYTEGPLVFKPERWDGDGVFYIIQTRDKMPDHPHSPRFLCQMFGLLGEARFHDDPAGAIRDGLPAVQRTTADASLFALAPDLARAARHYRERAEVAESRLSSLETAWALHGTSLDAVLEVETARQEAAALTARLERYETMYTVPAIPIDPEAEARVDEYLRGLRRQPEPGSRAWSTSSAVHGLPETSDPQRLPSGGGRDGGES